MMKTYEPCILGYQLLGDSQLLRFSEKVLRIRRKKLNGDNYCGLCISGQKIEDLLRRIRKGNYASSEKIILMIGTNDLLQKVSFKEMRFRMETLVLQLIKNGAIKIILLTLPPIPKLQSCSYHWCTLQKFNEYIKSLHNGEDICVIDAYEKFIDKSHGKIELEPCSPSSKSDWKLFLERLMLSCRTDHDLNSSSPSYINKCCICTDCADTDSIFRVEGEVINLDFFEKNYADKKYNKEDLIHLNLHGLEEIRKLILNYSYIKL